ncbi:MAG: hypothetical protein IBX44_03330 [Sulfurospirillum sp.]|nr:hypothetical protein [Sulfurospirillum sp.]
MKNFFFFSFLRSILILGLYSSIATADVFSPKQLETLKMVREIALAYPNAQGETFANTAMAICLSETSAGVFKVGDIGKDPNIFKASLGIMQVRLETAKFLAQKLDWKEVLAMSDVKLVNKLLGDDKFNATVAVRFLVWLNDYTNQNYFKTVSRYNGGNYNHPYYQRVMKNMQLIRSKAKLD